MSAILDPIISEFDTAEQVASYDRWLLAKAQEAQETTKPLVPTIKLWRRLAH